MSDSSTEWFQLSDAVGHGAASMAIDAALAAASRCSRDLLTIDSPADTAPAGLPTRGHSRPSSVSVGGGMHWRACGCKVCADAPSRPGSGEPDKRRLVAISLRQNMLQARSRWHQFCVAIFRDNRMVLLPSPAPSDGTDGTLHLRLQAASSPRISTSDAASALVSACALLALFEALLALVWLTSARLAETSVPGPTVAGLVARSRQFGIAACSLAKLARSAGVRVEGSPAIWVVLQLLMEPSTDTGAAAAAASGCCECISTILSQDWKRVAATSEADSTSAASDTALQAVLVQTRPLLVDQAPLPDLPLKYQVLYGRLIFSLLPFEDPNPIEETKPASSEAVKRTELTALSKQQQSSTAPPTPARSNSFGAIATTVPAQSRINNNANASKAVAEAHLSGVKRPRRLSFGNDDDGGGDDRHAGTAAAAAPTPALVSVPVASDIWCGGVRGHSDDTVASTSGDTRPDLHPAVNPAPFAAARAKLAGFTTRDLQSLLQLNEMKRTGTKQEMIERAVEAVVNGRMPRCPLCKQGFLRKEYELTSSGQTPVFHCPGGFNDALGTKLVCSFRATSIARPPWDWGSFQSDVSQGDSLSA